MSLHPDTRITITGGGLIASMMMVLGLAVPNSLLVLAGFGLGLSSFYFAGLFEHVVHG